MSDMAVFTSVAVAGSVVIVASGLSAFVAASGLSRVESKEADLEHAEVRANGASWWARRRNKLLGGDKGKSVPFGCNMGSNEEPCARGRGEHHVGARERSKAPPIEKGEARSVSREASFARNFQQPVQAERIQVKPVCREPPLTRSPSRASTVSPSSNTTPEPFQRAGGSAASSSSTPSPRASRRVSSHLTSATAVPLTPAASAQPQRPPQFSDTLTTHDTVQRMFISAASKLSDEELRDFVADFISAEIAAINKLSPELRGPAYRSLCIAWHPDKCPAIASIATSVFQHLQAQKNKIR